MKYRKYEDYHRVVDETEQKQCKNCLEWFDMNENNFGIVRKSKDGFNEFCKVCQKMLNRKYYEENREHLIEVSKKWQEENPEHYKEIVKKRDKNPSPKRRKTIGIGYVKQKANGYTKEWVRKNPDKMRGYRLNREQHKSHNITKEELQQLYEYADSKCMYCDMTEEYSLYYYGEKLHKDHAINEGSNGIDNCILACKGCNCSKHKKDWDEWFTPENPIFDINNYNKIKDWLDKFK